MPNILLRIIVGFCCAGLVFFSLPAGARPPDSAAASEASAGLVDQSIRLRRQGNDAEALSALEQAVELDPDSIRARVHLATCFQAVGDWLAADLQLSEALRHPDDPYVQRHREALEGAHRVIGDRIGILDIGGEPAGADVLMNGQKVGQLPMAEPIRATVGEYTLQVRMNGHYPISRPVTIRSRTLTRESVRLTPVGADATGMDGVSAEHTSSLGSRLTGVEVRPMTPIDADSGVPGWVTWGLVGLSGAAAATSVTGLLIQDANASRWNDDNQCLNVPGMSREELCQDERDAAKSANSVALVGGAAAVMFGAGALLIAIFADDELEAGPKRTWILGCSPTTQGANCNGSF